MQAAGSSEAAETSGAGEAESLDRRQALQKIGVGGAILWGAPLIAGTANAQAQGSVCGDRTIKWSALNQDPLGLPKTVVFNDVTVTISEAFYGGTTSYSPSGDPDHDVLTGPYGGVGSAAVSFLQLYQSAKNNGGRTLTFTFTKTGPGTPKPVQNIQFWITDVDYDRVDNTVPIVPGSGNYDDRVTFTPATFTRVNPAGSNVTGTGGAGANAFQNTVNGNVSVNNIGGSTRVTQAAPISTFTLDFWCGDRAYNGHHAIFISDISFNSCT